MLHLVQVLRLLLLLLWIQLQQCAPSMTAAAAAATSSSRHHHVIITSSSSSDGSPPRRSSQPSAPSGLLANWQPSPALGIDPSAAMDCSWIVPHIAGRACPETEQAQQAYQLQLWLWPADGEPSPPDDDSSAESPRWDAAWDSGRIATNIPRHRHHELLLPGRRYSWRIRTWAGDNCGSGWSTVATLVTAPQFIAAPIWAATNGTRYALLRKILPAPTSPYVRGTAFVTASQSNQMEKLLGSYRLFVGGVSVSIGPGRGDVRTAAYADGGDQNHTQFDSVDVSAVVSASGVASEPLSLGLQCYHETGGVDARVALELHLEHANGPTTVVRTDESWASFDATDAFAPGESEGPNSVCYTAPQENIDARLFPSGWMQNGFTEDKDWEKAVVRSWDVTPTPKHTLPLELLEGVVPLTFMEVQPGRHFADWGSNLMGGLKLELGGLAAGAKVQVTMSEELADTASKTLLYPMRTGNHYRSVWTAGPEAVSVFEHHEFKLFRYAEVKLLSMNATTPVFKSTSTCQEGLQGNATGHPASLTLTCPQWGGRRLITSVFFASFGTPSGTCSEITSKEWEHEVPWQDCNGEEHGGGGCGDSFVVNKSCHASSTKAVVEKRCIGKPSCMLPVSSAAFGGDPCPGVSGKRLAVDIICGNETRRLSAIQNTVSPPTVKLMAWTVRYPWVENDYFFNSSNVMLNQVWNLSVNTLRVTSLDTATDSNTRERLPYEGDALITGHSRLSLQREYAWPRHSFWHNMWNPTGTTEWRQTVALLAHLDYVYTGSLFLFDTFAPVMEQQAQIDCLDSLSQLPNFTTCERQTGGLGSPRENTLQDLIDTPAVGSGIGYRDGYVLSDSSTVIAAYLVGSLRALSEMHRARNDTHASFLAMQATATAAAINSICVDPDTGLYTDGPEGAAKMHSAWHASVFPTAFGLVPERKWRKVLNMIRRKRIAGSVYAAYWLLRALYHMDADHGSLALEMLTQCDTNSWCNMIRSGATTVMEAFSREGKPNLSWSHPWASAPASAIAWGFFGLRPTSPGFATFEFRPQPGNVSSASIKMPSLSGFIHATIWQQPSSIRVTLDAPANTLATVCLPKLGLPGLELVVDGVLTTGEAQRDYVCVDGIGSKSTERVIVRGNAMK